MQELAKSLDADEISGLRKQDLIKAIQSGPDKVHLTMVQSRIHRDGGEYNQFQTLWVFIRNGGRWGVKFRSSFLVNATENTNFSALNDTST